MCAQGNYDYDTPFPQISTKRYLICHNDLRNLLYNYYDRIEVHLKCYSFKCFLIHESIGHHPVQSLIENSLYIVLIELFLLRSLCHDAASYHLPSTRNIRLDGIFDELLTLIYTHNFQKGLNMKAAGE